MANRKQRRKLKQVNDEYEQSTKSILITLGVVLVIFILFYILTVAINNKNRRLNTKESTKAETTIQYSEILASNTFNQKPKEYYVLFYDFEGPEAVYLDYLFSLYASNENQYIYKVDLGNKMNSNVISDTSNSKASKASELKIKGTTLIKISNGKSVGYTEGSSQVIANKLSGK